MSHKFKRGPVPCAGSATIGHDHNWCMVCGYCKIAACMWYDKLGSHEEELMDTGEGFVIKDSGVRKTFESGMVRDTDEGKTRYWRVAQGPMLRRWAEHLGRGAKKYPDVAPGKSNWTLASGEPELQRFKESAFDHFMQWYYGQTDEDHAAAIFFNVNGAEYVKDKLAEGK